MVGVVFEDGRQSVGHVAGKVNIEFNILYSIVLTGCWSFLFDFHSYVTILENVMV